MRDLRKENERLVAALKEIRKNGHWTTVHQIIDAALNPVLYRENGETK